MSQTDEWFVKTSKGIRGPYTRQKLKALASSSKLNPEMRIRQGQDGEWVSAKTIEGLFDANRSAKPTRVKRKKRRSDSPKEAPSSERDWEDAWIGLNLASQGFLIAIIAWLGVNMCFTLILLGRFDGPYFLLEFGLPTWLAVSGLLATLAMLASAMWLLLRSMKSHFVDSAGLSLAAYLVLLPILVNAAAGRGGSQTMKLTEYGRKEFTEKSNVMVSDDFRSTVWNRRHPRFVIWYMAGALGFVAYGLYRVQGSGEPSTRQLKSKGLYQKLGTAAAITFTVFAAMMIQVIDVITTEGAQVELGTMPGPMFHRLLSWPVAIFTTTVERSEYLVVSAGGLLPFPWSLYLLVMIVCLAVGVAAAFLYLAFLASICKGLEQPKLLRDIKIFLGLVVIGAVCHALLLSWLSGKYSEFVDSYPGMAIWVMAGFDNRGFGPGISRLLCGIAIMGIDLGVAVSLLRLSIRTRDALGESGKRYTPDAISAGIVPNS